MAQNDMFSFKLAILYAFCNQTILIETDTHIYSTKYIYAYISKQFFYKNTTDKISLLKFHSIFQISNKIYIDIGIVDTFSEVYVCSFALFK